MNRDRTHFAGNVNGPTGSPVSDPTRLHRSRVRMFDEAQGDHLVQREPVGGARHAPHELPVPVDGLSSPGPNVIVFVKILIT